ncbi:MAG TPA: hypothetical protein VF306_09670 [Pirellulales bacterium]
MSRRHQGLYKPADLSYFIGELRRMSGRTEQRIRMAEANRADFWHALRLYLQETMQDPAFRSQNRMPSGQAGR